MIVREDKVCEGGRYARADGRRAKTRVLQTAKVHGWTGGKHMVG